MQITFTQADAAQSVRRLKFPPPFEGDFQELYYSRVRTALRIGLFLLLGLPIGLLCLSLSEKLPMRPDLVLGGAGLVSLLLLALSFRREFAAYWQPFVVGAIGLSTGIVSLGYHPSAIFFAGFSYLLVLFQVIRLQVRWVVVQMLAVNALVYLFQTNRQALSTELAVDLVTISLPLFLAYRNERGQRSRFADQLWLTQERRSEQQKLEQTEKMLHVLSQAIGSIAHDLGNPLTIVQGSAETLSELLKEDALDQKTEREFLAMITDGAQMLNALRLSLMEQTRVLEGKPILVERQVTEVGRLVQAGARYQQPKFSTGRQIALEGEELPLCVDEMRFITVFMNLIGNALKYSDGDVKVTWRTAGEHVLVGVLDQGRQAVGISQAQAGTLFVPFGRLDTHAQVEGTGLGLLSVRKIAAAHDGEAYIEGYTDGTAASPRFSTAQGRYPPMLQAGFCTAFVTACPWTPVPPSGEDEDRAEEQAPGQKEPGV